MASTMPEGEVSVFGDEWSGQWQKKFDNLMSPGEGATTEKLRNDMSDFFSSAKISDNSAATPADTGANKDVFNSKGSI